MTRSLDLARQAVARHELRGVPLDQAIAWAIRTALSEHADADRCAPLPRGAAAVVALLEDHRELTPKRLALRRGTSVEASRQVLGRLVADGVVERIRHGTYRLAADWPARAAAMVDRLQANLSRGGRTAANARHAARRRGAA